MIGVNHEHFQYCGSNPIPLEQREYVGRFHAHLIVVELIRIVTVQHPVYLENVAIPIGP